MVVVGPTYRSDEDVEGQAESVTYRRSGRGEIRE